MQCQVSGPEKDLHSGNDGGVFNEPLADLTKVLASLIDSRNNIQVGLSSKQLSAINNRRDGHFLDHCTLARCRTRAPPHFL